MIITCEACGISFNLDERLLKPAGSKVRCSKCKTVFTAYPPKPEEEPQEEPEEEKISPAVAQKADAASDDDLDFSGLEDMLDSDDATADDAKKGDDSDVEVDEIGDELDEEIDISGLEDMLDSTDDMAGRSVQEKTMDEDLDLSFDSDEMAEAEKAVPETTEIDDIDLDISFDSDISDETDAPREEADAEMDLDLDLDLSLEPDEADEEKDSDADEDLDDLDLDLSLEPDDEDEETPDAEDDDLADLDLELELDAADGEGTLESDLLSTKTVSEVENDTDDLDLELDIDEEEGDDSEEEIDLAELEQTLEMELLSPSDAQGDREELENVDLELSDDEDIMDDVDEDIDIADDADVSDIEQMLEMDLDEKEGGASDEMELEFDVDSAEDKKESAMASAKGRKDDDDYTSLDMTKSVKKETKPSPVPNKKPAEKKKVSTSLVILIVLLLLVGAAAGGYFLLVSQGVKLPSLQELNIPYISDLLNPDANKDLGMVETVQNTVKSEFVDNATLGKLFVITGSVKNSTSKACHSVKVTAKLYATGKKLAKSKTVYAGTRLSKEELAMSDLESLNKHMANPLSDTGQPIRIMPGGEIPFMIILPNLPENLEEYKVMVTESVME